MRFSILAFLIFCGIALPVYSQDGDAANNTDEFGIFDEAKSGDKSTKPDKNIFSGFYMNLSLGYSSQQDSLYIPKYITRAVDPWVFSIFLQYKANYFITETFGLNINTGVHDSNQNRDATLQLLQSYNALGPLENTIPKFSDHLSFTRFKLYELSAEYNFGNKVFLEIGVLPLLQGGSFYINPVSFFERYFNAKDYFQEYTAFSSPAFGAEFLGGLYTATLLYVPPMPSGGGANVSDTGGNLSSYLGYAVRDHVFMFKNSFNLAPVLANLYFFPLLKPGPETFYFGSGLEAIWNITNTLGVSGQLMVSNGLDQDKIVKNSVGAKTNYTLEPEKGSKDKYYVESLASVAFSGIKGYEISFSYYYNGRGYSDNQYGKMVDGLIAARKGLSLDSSSREFYSDVLSSYDPFNLSRHYLILNISNIGNADYFTWGIVPFVSTKDFSTMLAGYANFIINSKLTLYLQTTWNLGENRSVFGESFLYANITGGIELKF